MSMRGGLLYRHAFDCVSEATVAADCPLGPDDITLIVPVGGAAPAWPACARSLAALDPPPGEIIAVIDGADERLASIAAGIGAKTISLSERGGPARARNRGARETDRKILFFVDSDVEIPRGLIADVARIFSDDNAPAAIMGSYDMDPGDPGFLSQHRNLLHHFVHQEGLEQASTFWTGCGAIRRDVFLEVGGFDESYPVPSIEDIELGMRLRRGGHSIRLMKSLQVKHLKRWRLGDMMRTDLLRRAAPWTELMLREGEFVNDLNVKTRDRLSVALAFLLPITFAAGFFWPPLFALLVLSIVGLSVLNRGFFTFLAQRRGVFFALAAGPVYWAYLVVCGLGFAIGLLRHAQHRTR